MKRLRIIDHGHGGYSSDRSPHYVHEPHMGHNPVHGYSHDYGRESMPVRNRDYDYGRDYDYDNYSRSYENDYGHNRNRDNRNRDNRNMDRNPGRYNDYSHSRNKDYDYSRGQDEDYDRNDYSRGRSRGRKAYSRENRRSGEQESDEGMSDDMDEYISKHGWHFSKKLCDYAVSKMEKAGSSGESVPFRPLTKEQVDTLLKQNSIVLDNDEGYDACYVANMAKADFYGSSIIGEANLARFIKDYIDDPDGYEGLPLKRYYRDCEAKGGEIPWGEVI